MDSRGTAARTQEVLSDQITTLRIKVHAGCDGCHHELWKTGRRPYAACNLGAQSRVVPSSLVPSIVPVYQEVNNLVVSAECSQLGWLSPRIAKPYDSGLNQPPRVPQGNLDREESQLWRWALMFMILLAVALAGLLWERLENIPYQLRAIPIGVLVLSILFAVYAYGRRREVSELKGVLRGLQEHVGAAPSEEQLDQLSQVIMRSQRNFKELIDSFDDPACAVALDGTLRTVNKRVTELTGITYSDLVGRKIYEFVEEPTREEAESELGTLSG